ncbi:MAG: DsrE family protein [Rhizobiales bacterium]|nr:DsrE family protein [Hyphomicrobiales bacterium]MBN9009713.1 DsrE family protein [Hyphomicrobiales bacterium]
MKTLFALALALSVVAAPGLARAAEPAGLTIDVPVVLKKADVVMNMDHLAFDGKEPFGLLYMRLMTERFAADRTDWRIVAVFHGPAGYMILGDKAYDRVRKTRTGNPYRAEIEKLQKAGVRFELCGQTAKEKGWGNADLLAGVQVNSGANFRIVELVQQGYVQIQP